MTYAVLGGRALYEGRSLSEWVSEVVDAVVNATQPNKVILFGSVARGDDGPDSDIDLMVVLPSLDYSKRREVESRLYLLHHVPPVQVFVTDERECRRRRDVIGSMHYWPLREGRVVYERAS